VNDGSGISGTSNSRSPRLLVIIVAAFALLNTMICKMNARAAQFSSAIQQRNSGAQFSSFQK
jgi:hypothetical protein